MVDCDYFTEFNKLLLVEDSRILLDYKNCNYNIEMYIRLHQTLRQAQVQPHRQALLQQAHQGTPAPTQKIPIKAVYGIIEMEVNSYIGVVTRATVIGEVCKRKIYQVFAIELVPLAAKEDPRDQVYVK